MPKTMIAAVAIAAAAAVPATARGDAQEFFEVRADRGVPRIFRNGAPMPSRVFFGSFLHGGFPKSWEAVPRQFSYALDAGVPFFETHGDLFWDGCDEKKVAALNKKRADAFFAKAEGRPCWMLVRMLCNPPKWWMDAHPETYSEWNDRSGLTGWIAKHPMQTLASEFYRSEAVKAIKKTIDFYEREYPGRMAGYHLAGLHTSEWVYDGNYTPETEGYDRPTREGFARYLERKYGKAPADVSVPTHAQRTGDGVKFLREPADPQDARLLDFNEYRTKLVSETICLFAKTARAARPGRLVGFFYGYIAQGSWYGGGGRNGYLSLRDVLDSPDIDFFCSPFNYNWRRREQPLATQGMLHSIALAGKLWLNEDDTATYLACRTNDGGPSMFSKCPTPEETADMLRRNLAYTYMNNHAIWWMDLNGAGWFDDPAIWKTMREFAPLERLLLEDPQTSNPEFAVAFDQRGSLHFEGGHSKESAPPNWASGMVGEFSSLGAPPGICLSDDVLEGRAPWIRAAVFPTSYAMDGETRRRMRAWAAAHGTVWVWAPGWIDLDTGRASAAAVKDATGFEVRELDSRRIPKVRATKEGRALFGLPETFGPFTRFGVPKLDVFSPVLSPVPAPGDTVLARYAEGGEPAVVLRRSAEGAPQVFSGTYQVPRELVRGVAAEAGVHFYAPSGTAVYTNGRDIGLYAMEDGEIPVSPKRPGVYRDYFTGTEYAGAQFIVKMRKGQTVLLVPSLAPKPPDNAHNKANRSFAGFPSVAVSPSGNLLWATWEASPTGDRDAGGYAVLATSDDRGEHWREVLCLDPDGAGALRASVPKVEIASDGSLHWTFLVSGGDAKPSRLAVAFDAERTPAAPFPEPVPSGGESVAGLDAGQGMRLPGGADMTVENVAGKGLSAFISYDGGRTKLGGLVLDPSERPGARFDAAQGPDGTIWIVWDGDRRTYGDIRFARICEADIRMRRLFFERKKNLADSRVNGVVSKKYLGVAQAFDGRVDEETAAVRMIETPVYNVSGRTMTADIDCRELKAELLDGLFRPIPGFTLEEAVPVSGKGRRTISWKGNGDLARVKGRDVTVRFRLQEGRLASFAFTEAAAEGGK